MDWADDRAIESMTFGLGAPPEVGARVREILLRAGARHADDIAWLGCTGLYGALRACGDSHEEALANVRFVRANIAGAGIGLTCYIDREHYCEAHETIGGLEDNQKARHTEHASAISRDLTPSERGHVVLVNAARRAKGADKKARAFQYLTGEELPPDFVSAESAAESSPGAASASTAESAAAAPLVATSTPASVPALASAPAPAADALDPLLQALEVAVCAGATEAAIDRILAGFPKSIAARLRVIAFLAAQAAADAQQSCCPEHAQLNWSCKTCIARRIANGPHALQYLLFTGNEPKQIDLHETILPVDGASVDAHIAEYDAGGIVETAALYVKCATWYRRLRLADV